MRKKKYRNKRVTSADGKFDSKREFKRWHELKLLESRGDIQALTRQQKYIFPLEYDSGRKISYVADYIYIENGKTVVEDSKGFKTKEYKIKKAMMKYFFNIDILES